MKEGLSVLMLILRRLSETPSHWFTGVGLFNYAAFKKEGEGIGNYHNSYFEILFGLGVPLFLLFMVFMLYEPAKQFIKACLQIRFVLDPIGYYSLFRK